MYHMSGRHLLHGPGCSNVIQNIPFPLHHSSTSTGKVSCGTTTRPCAVQAPSLRKLISHASSLLRNLATPDLDHFTTKLTDLSSVTAAATTTAAIRYNQPATDASMSEYLPSFIVEPVLRQARRFSERIGGEESPAAGVGFTLPAVPDFQRFYPTRFWTQSPPPITTEGGEGLVDAPLDISNVSEEGTLRSIARNIQLWANQINNLDIEDEVIQEQVLPSVEQDDSVMMASTDSVVVSPIHVGREAVTGQSSAPDTVQGSGSRSSFTWSQSHQPQRTNSETSINPAHELSYWSQSLEQNGQARSQSDPFAAVNALASADSMSANPSRQGSRESGFVRASDGSGILPEDDGMQPLRQKINAIWAGPGTSQEKSRMVHVLMTERYRSIQSKMTPTSSATATSPPFRATSPLSLGSVRSEETIFHLSATDLKPTYAPVDIDDGPNEMTGEIPKPDLGCIHYKRNVKMQCAECEKWYTCRICHDAKEDHQLPRRETKNMLCMLCSTPQPVSQVCKMCHEQAAYYYCSICKLWNNDASKAIYHCEDCGICRLGQGLGKDFFHCKTCAACMSIAAESTHRCIERSTKCDCPICGEFMFTSSQPVTFMRCGHSIHEACFTEWCNTSYKCPICSKSIANMESQFRRLDRHIEEQPMPDEYSNNRAYVFCNDCNSRSVVKYHWLGLKCGVCDSYNTAQLELLGAASPVIQERRDLAQEMGVGEAGITISQSHTPTEDLVSPSRPGTGHATPSSNVRQGATIGTPRSAIAIPARRESPFRNLPHSPTRSVRAMSPVVGSYFGTGQRAVPSENRRGSYFSVLSFGANNDEAMPSNSNAIISNPAHQLASRSRPSRLSQAHLSPPASVERGVSDLDRDSTLLDDDDDMDFWGRQSPRSHDADIVDLETEPEAQEDEESSSDEDEMEYEDEDGEEDEDPMDILIGHR